MPPRPVSPARTLCLPLLAVAALVAGCASGPNAPTSRAPTGVVAAPGDVAADLNALTIGGAVAELAMGMVGARYRYGGADPAEGFDCSGLAFYAYTQAGYRIPRTSQEQFRAARKIALRDAAAGDLVFFQDQEKLSHVGIYLGDGMFVHAPANGRRVAVASMDSAYYQQHLVAVGRLLPAGL